MLLSGILETAVEYGVSPSQSGTRNQVSAEGGERESARFANLPGQLQEPHRPIVSLIAATGFRIGDLLALRWRALDLEIGTLAVRESVFERQFQRPKTQKAVRTIPLGPHVAVLLCAHKLRVGRTAPEELVFANRLGRPFRESKLLRTVLQPAAETAGLGRVT